MKTLTSTRFQYNLSLLNGGSTTVRVEQKVNGVYQYLATQQTQTSSGTYELSFVPNYEDIRISVSGTSRYALQNLYLDRDQIDTLVTTYALSRGYRYGFQAQEKDDEVSGKGNSYTAEFWQYDSRLGRRWNIDPKPNPSISNYACFANNPIMYSDPFGDTIRNGVSDIVKQKQEMLDISQSNYDNLISSHQGKLTKKDINNYEKDSGLKNAQKELKTWQNIESNINLMIETFATVMSDDFNKLNNLSTDIIINYVMDVGKSGVNNPASTLIPANEIYMKNQNGVAWDGTMDGNIEITFYGGGVYPLKTNYLANEFGDIDYFFTYVKPYDIGSYNKQRTTGSSQFPDYYSDPEGAGQKSFEYQFRFEKAFKKISSTLPADKINFILHK